MNNCRHVLKIRPSLVHSVLNPQKWSCNECSTAEDIWACISCSYVACGKYMNDHIAQHYHKSNHPLSINVQEKYLFCFECQDYVLNDNAAGDIKILRNCLQTFRSSPNKASTSAALDIWSTESQGIGHCRRSSRVQKANSLVTLLQNEIDNNEESTHVELWFRRYYLLAHWFHKWKNRTKSIEKVSPKILRSTKDSLKRTRSTLGDASTDIRVMLDRESKRRCHSIPAATGLQNLGNTCYMNSILQVLRHLNPFSRVFIQDNEKRNGSQQTNGHSEKMVDLAEKIKDPPQMIADPNSCSTSSADPQELILPQIIENNDILQSNNKRSKASRKTIPTKLSLSHELHSLLRIMWSGKMSMVSPHKMLYAVWNIIPFFRGYSQQDAQEFLSEFLDKVQSEMDLNGHRLLPLTPIVNGNHPSIDLVTQLFQGELVSQVKCLTCGHESSKREAFMDLSLEFPIRFHSRISNLLNVCLLEEMLTQFTGVEKLDKIYVCEECNSKIGSASTSRTYTEAEKRFLISKLPNVLRLHLKRFMWSGGSSRGKITVNVEFPRQLDVSKFCHSSAGGSFFYNLSAVVMHHGRGFGSGHYTAYCWNEEADSWLHCNDAKMQKVSLNDVFKAQAYILLYTKSFTSPRKSSLRNAAPNVEQWPHTPQKKERTRTPCSITRFSEMEKKQRLSESSIGHKVKRTKTTIW